MSRETRELMLVSDAVIAARRNAGSWRRFLALLDRALEANFGGPL